MGIVRPFAAILEDIHGLCNQLADAHSHELAAKEASFRLPRIPAHPQAPPCPQPSSNQTLDEAVEEVLPGFFGLLSTAKDNIEPRPASPGRTEEAVEVVPPGLFGVRPTVRDTEMVEVVPPGVFGVMPTAKDDAPATVEQPLAPGRVEEVAEAVPPDLFGVMPTAEEKGFTTLSAKWKGVQKKVGPAPASGTEVIATAIKKNWQELSIAVKKEQLAEELHTRADKAEMGGFKKRDIWNISDEDLLRIKIKARRGVKSSRDLVSDGHTNRVEQKRDWFMIHPQSFGRLCWDVLGILWLAYDVVMLPIQVFPVPESILFVVADYLGNIYWTWDMGMSFFTGTYSKSLPVLLFKPVAQKYIRSWLPFDIFLVLIGWSSVAAESLMGDMDGVQMARATRTARFMRILRYLRLARLLRIVKGMRMFSDLQARANSEMGIFILGVVKLNAALVLVSHVLACCWYGIGNVPDGWVRTQSTFTGMGILDWDMGDQYLYSYQWSLARLHPSSIKDNLSLRTTGERVFSIFGGICAMVVGAGFISTITNMMREFQEKHQRRKRNLHLVQSYVLKYTISTPVAVRAKRYIELEHEAKLKWQREVELMQILPHDLVLDFQYEAFSPVTAKHDFFAEIHSKHLRTHYDICHRALSNVLIVSGEIVFAAGDAGSTMRFVTSGKFSYAFRSAAIHRDGNKKEESPEPYEPFRMLGGFPLKHNVANVCELEHADDSSAEEVEERKVKTAAVAVEVGSWLSEAVLWTPWEHRGALYAENGGTLLGVNFEEWALLFKEHEQAHVAASIHARCFVEELNHVNAAILSDLPARPAKRETDVDLTSHSMCSRIFNS